MAANYLNAHLLYLDYLDAVEAEGERVINRINDFENMTQGKFWKYIGYQSVVEKVHSGIEYRLVHVTNRNFPLSLSYAATINCFKTSDHGNRPQTTDN